MHVFKLMSVIFVGVLLLLAVQVWSKAAALVRQKNI
jgi:hypothetical protein